MIIVDGEDKVTLTFLVHELYNKYSTSEFVLKKHLDFLIVPLVSVDEIRTKLDDHMKDWMPTTNINRICKKVAKNVKSIPMDFCEKFNNINDAQKSIKIECKKICHNINFVLSENNDSEFVESYEHWMKKKPDRNHMKHIQSELNGMELKCLELHKICKMHMNNIDQIIEIIEKNKAAVRLLSRDLLNETDRRKVKKIVDDLLPLLDILPLNLLQLTQWLKFLEYCLLNYNVERKRWAEFFIGMRECPKSDRKPLPPMPDLVIDKTLSDIMELWTQMYEQ